MVSQLTDPATPMFRYLLRSRDDLASWQGLATSTSFESMTEMNYRVCCLLIACSFAAPPLAGAQRIGWTTSPQRASDDAHASGRMILVSVGADWCHYCKKMDREVWSDPAVAAQLADHFVPLKLSDREHGELIQALQVTSYPTTFVFSSDRRLLARLSGYITADQFRQTVAQLRSGNSRSTAR